MANDNINDVNIKVGLDTSNFDKDLKNLEKQISSSQKIAEELQKGLKLEFNNEQFLTAQRQLQNALQLSEEKARAIKDELEKLEKVGQIGTDNYKELQTTLALSENELVKINSQVKELEKIKLDNSTFAKLSEDMKLVAQETAELSKVSSSILNGMNNLTKSSVEAGDEIAKLASQYDLSSEAIQKWNYIALQCDLTSQSLYSGVSMLKDVIGKELAGESDSSTEAIKSLGISIESLKNSDQAFINVIDALSNLQDGSLQAKYASQIFGSELSSNILPLLKVGSKNINEYAKEFEQIGYLSTDQVKALTDYDNMMNRVNTQFANAKLQLGTALLPVLETFSEVLTTLIIPALQSLTSFFSQLSPLTQQIISVILMLVATISPFYTVVSKVIGVFSSFGKALSSVNNILSKTSLGFLALGSAFMLAFDLIGNWSEMSTLGKVLQTIALAALTAAAAITIFHASWSLGLAVGAIAAAVVAGIGTIKGASKSIGVDVDFTDTASVKESALDYSMPSTSTGINSGSNSYIEDNSQYNINVNLNSTGNLEYDSKTLAEEVIKQIVIQKQAGGR